MSLFAKIMVLVNLILAVMFLSAAGTFLGATDNWKTKHEQAVASATQEREALTAQKNQAQSDADSANERLGEVERENAGLSSALNTLQTSNEQLNGTVQSLQENLATLTTAQADLQNQNESQANDISRLQGEVAAAKADASSARDEQETLRGELATTQQALADAEDQLAAQEAANTALAERLDAANTTVALYRNEVGPLGDVVAMKPVDGVVQAVDAEMDIVVISVGSKDGVKVGYEFTVYRGDDYVSKIVIDKVYDNYAAGSTKANMGKKAIQAGDKVSTQL